MTIKVSDYDHGGYDDLVANCHLLNEIAKGTLEPRWVRLSASMAWATSRMPRIPARALDTCYGGCCWR